MTGSLRQTVIALGAAVMLAAISVVSAHHMVPDRPDPERTAALQAAGALAEDLCGAAESRHDHRCPFCHKLPEAPRIAAPDHALRVAWIVDDPTGGHLVLVPQHLSDHVSVRAPPRLA
jgi:hypothetical protein